MAYFALFLAQRLPLYFGWRKSKRNVLGLLFPGCIFYRNINLVVFVYGEKHHPVCDFFRSICSIYFVVCAFKKSAKNKSYQYEFDDDNALGRFVARSEFTLYYLGSFTRNCTCYSQVLYGNFPRQKPSKKNPRKKNI